jgi:hypothetical protein
MFRFSWKAAVIRDATESSFPNPVSLSLDVSQSFTPLSPASSPLSPASSPPPSSSSGLTRGSARTKTAPNARPPGPRHATSRPRSDQRRIRPQFLPPLLISLVLTSPAQAAWDRFEIIQWQDRDAAQFATLRRLGVTAAKLMADRDGTGIPLDRQTPIPQQAGLRWYIENIATDFYASYHRYTPGKPVNWRFLEAQRQYRANVDDNTALFRVPSLLDPSWRDRVATRLTGTVHQQSLYHPLYYSLGDETGIADLSAYWDFDLSPASVDSYRQWLRKQYKSLDALNAEWDTAYPTWNSIQPETTNAAMHRAGDNFAAWNDFKAFMDTSFADALRFGTDAIHRADPAALSAIEGAQLPGWGGYDYTKLAHAVDVIEGGDETTRAIVRSINPAVIPLITSFEATPDELHDIWRAVLGGARGLILWDEDNSIVGPDAALRPRGQAYAPLFAALRGEIGRRMIVAQPDHDPIAVLYSPLSFRVQWMLDHRPAGDAWMHRAADVELEDNAWRVAMRGFMLSLARMGLHPRFITEQDLETATPAARTLILPDTIALSAAAAKSIARFASLGGQVIADVPPAAFDGHGRRRAAPPSIPVTIVPPNDLGRVLTLKPPYRIDAPDVDTFTYRSNGRLLLALLRRAAGHGTETVTVDLHGSAARDIATGHDYGHTGNLVMTLDPVAPTILELGPREVSR